MTPEMCMGLINGRYRGQARAMLRAGYPPDFVYLFIKNKYESKNLWNGELVQGSFNSSTGGFVGTKVRVRDKSPWTITQGVYTISAKGVESVVVYIYDLDGTLIKSESVTTWQDLPYIITIKGDRLICLGFRLYNDTEINPSDVEVTVTKYKGG